MDESWRCSLPQTVGIVRVLSWRWSVAFARVDERAFLLLGLSAILVLGVAAQWLAWRMKLPAILILLAFGLLVGPVSQMVADRKLIDPEVIFGNLVQPIVSLSVAIVLFEGSLTLNI